MNQLSLTLRIRSLLFILRLSGNSKWCSKDFVFSIFIKKFNLPERFWRWRLSKSRHSHLKAGWLRKTGPDSGATVKLAPVDHSHIHSFRRLVPVSPCTRRTKYRARLKLQNKARDFDLQSGCIYCSEKCRKIEIFSKRKSRPVFTPRKIDLDSTRCLCSARKTPEMKWNALLAQKVYKSTIFEGS